MQTPSMPSTCVLVALFDTPNLGVIRFTTQKMKERGKVSFREDRYRMLR